MSNRLVPKLSKRRLLLRHRKGQRNQALLNEQQVGTKAIEAEITAQASQGATPVLLAVDGKAVAQLAVRDPLRSESVAALQLLHKAGYRLLMLTADNTTTANSIAK